MKCYQQIHCKNMEEISQGIYGFLQMQTDIVTDCQPGWHFVKTEKLLLSVPKLLEYFRAQKFVVRHAAVTVVLDNNSLPIHVDQPPVIAKLNMPVINTKGWSNCWWKDNAVICELADQDQPIVFNSQIPHSVVQTGVCTIPRIVASFTLHNEPLYLLQ